MSSALPEVVRAHLARLGTKGGYARAKALTPRERQEISRMGGRAAAVSKRKARNRLRRRTRSTKKEA